MYGYLGKQRASKYKVKPTYTMATEKIIFSDSPYEGLFMEEYTLFLVWQMAKFITVSYWHHHGNHTHSPGWRESHVTRFL